MGSTGTAGPRPHDVTLYRTAELSAAPTAHGQAGPENTGVDYYHAMVLPGGIGYLRMDAFDGSQDDELIGSAMRLLANTQGLLIDVRKNGGGDQSGNTLLSRLITAPITRYRTSPRMSDFTLAQRPQYFSLAWHDEHVEPVQQQAGRYNGKPVVLLTSPYCFSACDTFTSALKVNHLATVVGEPTGGGTGSPLVFELPVTGLRFRYSVVRGQTADSHPLEGVGTQPDQLIERTQGERIAGRDLQLLSALQILGRQIHDRNAPTGPTPSAPTVVPMPQPELEAALDQLVQTRGAIWLQDSTLSPTRAELKQLSQ
jgi:C-terminal processing protease CtpA/Prc